MKLFICLIGMITSMAYADIDHFGVVQKVRDINEAISAETIKISSNHKSETLLIILLKKGERFKSIPTDEAVIDCKNSQARLDFQNDYFRIKNRSLYYIMDKIECGKTTTWTFEETSEQGQAIGIYYQAYLAMTKLKELNLLESWNRRIDFKWPSNGDYYSFGSVNITRGDYWDVVGHELGHAIYDLADIGAFGGGSHRIDECYSTELALSEGWASFFSAWLNVKLDDSDAKFEFLVQRRAPIRFENIPSDVCSGQRNEWRVTGFLWDIIDHNNDGESARITFKELWNVTLNRNYYTTKEIAYDLKKIMDPLLVNIVWKNNFLTEL